MASASSRPGAGNSEEEQQAPGLAGRAVLTFGAQAWAARHLAQAQSTVRGLWAATVVWLCMLLVLEVLLTGTAPSWLKAMTCNSFQSTPWLSWVAVGTVTWLGSVWLVGLQRQGPAVRQSSAVSLLLRSILALTDGTTDSYIRAAGCNSRCSSAASSSCAGNGSSATSSSNCSRSRSSATSNIGGDDDDGNGSAAPVALPQQRLSLDRRVRRQLGLGSSRRSGVADAWNAVAGAAGPAGPGSHLQELQRRLSQFSAHKVKVAYSDAHAGSALILYVDNSPIDQAVASALLGNEPGLQLVCVSSGAEALELVLGAQWLPDLIMMDVLLPDMMASEVCNQLRSVFGRLELPIVLLSSRSGEADMLAALECGVNDFLIKPLRRIELLARINSQMMIKQGVRREAESRSHYELLVQVLPPHIIRRLATGQAYIPEQHEQVTILFSDIVGFTELCSLWPTQDVVAMLDILFSAFDDLCDKHGVFKVETVGDAYMAVAGHDGSSDHTLRMAAMAVDMLAATEDVQLQLMAQGREGRRVQIRVGMHTGPAHSGVVGKRRPRYCFFGDSVNTASRMESSGYPMTVHISDACAHSMTAVAAAAASGNRQSNEAQDSVLQVAEAAAADAQQQQQHLGSSQVPWELLDIGVRHVKGKGWMRTHLLKTGEWAAAVRAARARQMREAADMLNDSSTTCSTCSFDDGFLVLDHSPSPPSPHAAAADSCCSDIVSPASGVALPLRPYRSLGSGSLPVGLPDPCGVVASGTSMAAADSAMAVEPVDSRLAEFKLQDEFVARRCSSAYLGSGAAAPVGFQA